MERSNPAKWEQWYPLANDPGLHAAGVEIGARVTPQPKGPPQLRIVFRAGGKEASVDCVHVAVYAGSLESLPPEAELARSSEHDPVTLPAEEHFFALNSYVGGIAEVGLGAMFAMARESGNLPVGFNYLMQQQVLKALVHVAPAAALDFCLWAMDDATQAGERVPKLVLQAVAARKNVPPEILTHLARDDDKIVRCILAQNEHTPPEVLTQLAVDPDGEVRTMAVLNAHLPLEILLRFETDPEPSIRAAVAGNEHTPAEIINRLAANKDSNLRSYVALNKHAPPEVLARLAGDADRNVRRLVAQNRHTPPEALARLAGDADVNVRVAVAGNKHTPPELLGRLAGDGNVTVRRAVAWRKNLPLEIFTRLASDADEVVQRGANQHQST
jgi:hypothetical protein